MFFGAHVIIYSRNAEADRAFFRDVLEYPHADAGHGWLIFKLPPAEVAMHPADDGDTQELFFMCHDVQAFIEKVTPRGVTCSPIEELRWGSLTRMTLPSGTKLGVYQPKHPSPLTT
jgi:hypothetical protein